VSGAPLPGTVLGHVENWRMAVRPWLKSPLQPMATTQACSVTFCCAARSDVRAYVNRCAHFGVPLAAQQDLLKFQPHVRITCNVHYAHYRWSDGLCTGG